jgi:hypothetical protein
MTTLAGFTCSVALDAKITSQDDTKCDFETSGVSVGSKRPVENLELEFGRSKKLKVPTTALAMDRIVNTSQINECYDKPINVKTAKSPSNVPGGVSTHYGNDSVFPIVSEHEFIGEVQQVFSETSKGCIEESELVRIYHKYVHTLRGRSWSAEELRECREMLLEIGFHIEAPVELNQMLPEGAKKRNGQPVEEANLFVWRHCAQQLGIRVYQLYGDLEATEFDKLKWSRRAKSTNGLQNKLARHNGCYTDLEEPLNPLDKPELVPDAGDVTQDYVRHKHPKNPAIKFTNFAFKGELAKFRERFAKVLGPFGYKVRHQFAELNKYYKLDCGIGPHGDVERGLGDKSGAVNCLKVGRAIPLGFTWYHKTKPVGKEQAIPPCGSASFEPVTRKKKHWTKTAVSAVVNLGHGDFYMMSEKAIGKDWKSQDYALRHFAGHRKYTGLPKAYYDSLPKSVFTSAYSLTFSDCVENDSETPELQFSTQYA